MPHILLPDSLPGIRGLLAFRPETAAPLNALVDVLLRGPGTLSPGERELIATHVSCENECHYCRSIHGAVAAHHIGDASLVAHAVRDPERAPLTEKIKALLAIARQVARGGRHVTEADIARARTAGATDLELHDTVLIAAAFCMFNRYVDGLGTLAPDDPDVYRQRAALIAAHGYGGATTSTAQRGGSSPDRLAVADAAGSAPGRPDQ